ncbi:gamma-glutamyltransferase [Hwanghaeella sp.]|uniref:gamma-glutamyltransferase n=1 Tax=Hwanghaeella sp. TaxID=2605943 RepID=UPI003CCC4463
MAEKGIMSLLPGPVNAVLGACLFGGGSILIASVISALVSPAPAPDQTAAAPTVQTEPSQAVEGTAKEAIAPEPPTAEKAAPAAAPLPSVSAEKYMIAAAHPAAAQAGAQMLEKGGSAVDAAIASQMVLNVVEPQSSGIGGGAFMLHWDEYKRRLDSYDGRETAPAEMTPDVFLTASGEPKRFLDAVIGGASVGVPGLLKMLHMAHERHGKLPWADLFQPAIELAENGFPVSDRLYSLLVRTEGLRGNPVTKDYFYTFTGAPKAIGTILKNPDLAETFRLIADQGPDAFYTGEIGRDIVDAVQKAHRNPGVMTAEDLALYEAKSRPNLCGRYRDRLVCGMGPPSSGGVTVLQALGILDQFPLDEYRPGAPGTIALVGEASALAFADRNHYLADTDFVDVPVNALLENAYIRARAGLVDRAMGDKSRKDPGNPRGRQAAADTSMELPSTTHISIIDADGNAVSMTSSIESGFGSRLMVRGFLLNNQLTDFSFLAERDGKPIANRVEPGKRPRSSMAPTLVFDDDRELEMVLGSPGGSRIIGYVLQSILNTVDWGMDPQDAVSRTHYLSRNGGVEVEKGTPAGTVAQLRNLGFEVKERDMTSGLHMIVKRDGKLLGGADPRREGAAVGESQVLPDLNAAFDFIQAATD